MPIERDQFFVGERVVISLTLLRGDGTEPSGGELAGTTVTLTILPPPDGDTPRDDVDVGFAAAGNDFSGTYETLYEGWHEWRWATTGTIMGVEQGRFRVLPVNT